MPDVENPIKPSERGIRGKKVPTPYLIGGGVLIALLALYYFKRKGASQNATAPASVGDTYQGPGVDYSGSAGYDLGYAAGLQATGGYTSAGGSTGLDPTDLSSIVSAIENIGQGAGAGAGTASTNTGGVQSTTQPPTNVTINVGGGAPTGSAAPGTNTAGGTTGGTNPSNNGGNTGTTAFNASTTPISTQISDYEKGIITYNQLGPNARKVYQAGYSNLADYNAAQGHPRATTPTAYL